MDRVIKSFQLYNKRFSTIKENSRPNWDFPFYKANNQPFLFKGEKEKERDKEREIIRKKGKREKEIVRERGQAYLVLFDPPPPFQTFRFIFSTAGSRRGREK